MMMVDIINYYLGTPLPTYKYMRLPLTIIPNKIIKKCHLKEKALDGWVYLQILKGIYGLKQAGLS